MKKLILLFISIGLTITNAFSATTGTLIISGIIPVMLGINVVTLPLASNLTLNTAASNMKIATITEQSNSNTGYDIMISSLNAGKLKRVGSADFINYTVTYGSLSAATLSASPISAVSQSVSGVYVVNRDFGISYAATPYNSKLAGTYTDTVTLSIQAK